jgi:hypothetical protein
VERRAPGRRNAGRQGLVLASTEELFGCSGGKGRHARRSTFSPGLPRSGDGLTRSTGYSQALSSVAGRSAEKGTL